MKKSLLAGLILLTMIFYTAPAYANDLEAYQTARVEYISAWVALGTYNDRIGRIVQSELSDAGWDMKVINEQSRKDAEKVFFIENNDFEAGKEVYLVAVTGTESKKDIAMDLNINKAFFGGNSPESFQEAAKKTDLVSSDPMIHRGFHQYTQSIFFTPGKGGNTFGEYLAELLKQKSNRKVYLIGHSLGGAAVTIAAARLQSMGVNPAQIAVITFGAPAIGNQAFADLYGKSISLDRIVIKGDPVKSSLQGLAGGYTQFGEAKIWQENRNSDKFKHAMVVYLDAALRNFYDKKEAAQQAGFDVEAQPTQKTSKSKAYIAPLSMTLDDYVLGDRHYMEESVKDVFRHRLPGCVFGLGKRGSFEEEIVKAAAAGCDRIVFAAVSVKQLQKEHYTFHVNLQEDVYSVDGNLQGSFICSTNTSDFTPIQATLHNLTSIKTDFEHSMDTKKVKLESR
ncbi:Lipase (class 3) [Propionispira arboris]|uniref:Lipase (Class 3) n=1 Tax=Propionispira arboris TaxID=84035 RepID=A0A1H6UAW0_9FIRM|nr:lipase family protein [Propionispira arboris]SEI88696.1 Lipase (class 3) [Propionispira arboris]